VYKQCDHQRDIKRQQKAPKQQKPGGQQTRRAQVTVNMTGYHPKVEAWQEKKKDKRCRGGTNSIKA